MASRVPGRCSVGMSRQGGGTAGGERSLQRRVAGVGVRGPEPALAAGFEATDAHGPPAASGWRSYPAAASFGISSATLISGTWDSVLCTGQFLTARSTASRYWAGKSSGSSTFTSNLLMRFGALAVS
jgi:hypothetical protein